MPSGREGVFLKVVRGLLTMISLKIATSEKLLYLGIYRTEIITLSMSMQPSAISVFSQYYMPFLKFIFIFQLNIFNE